MTEEQLIHRSIEHLHGSTEVPYGEDELIVVCTVRDGRPYVESFVEHYFSLGVKHLVFLDNGSTDGTVEALKKYDNVTVLQTKLFYKEYEDQMRQYLITRFGKGRWSLCVDIDELFDYPYSDVIGLDSLLSYLNSKSYTAVAAQMLDMFPEKPLSSQVSNLHEPLKELHRFYDISNIRRKSMKNYARRYNNTLDSEEVETFRGGIRETLFGFRPVLRKFPLVFLDGKVKPSNGSLHHISKAAIADFTCVLLHYKFLDEYFHKRAAQAVQEQNYRNPAAYKKYLEILDKDTSLQVKQETSEELKGVNDLLENQFLVVSEDYVSWVNAEEEKSVLQVAPQSEPLGLIEAFLESRRRERTKTLKIQRLERQLRTDQQHLTQRIRSLEQQLKSIQASRTWKLIKLLSSIKARVLSLGKSSS